MQARQHGPVATKRNVRGRGDVAHLPLRMTDPRQGSSARQFLSFPTAQWMEQLFRKFSLYLLELIAKVDTGRAERDFALQRGVERGA
jgi:hypothetical protein